MRGEGSRRPARASGATAPTRARRGCGTRPLSAARGRARDLHDFSAPSPARRSSPTSRVPAARRRAQGLPQPPPWISRRDVVAFSCGVALKALVWRCWRAPWPPSAAASRCTPTAAALPDPDWVEACEAAGIAGPCREGPLSGQRRLRGLLREAEGRSSSTAGTGAGSPPRPSSRSSRVHPLVPGGQAQGLRRGRQDGVRYDQGPQGAARAGRLGLSKKSSASPNRWKSGKHVRKMDD